MSKKIIKYTITFFLIKTLLLLPVLYFRNDIFIKVIDILIDKTSKEKDIIISRKYKIDQNNKINIVDVEIKNLVYPIKIENIILDLDYKKLLTMTLDSDVKIVNLKINNGKNHELSSDIHIKYKNALFRNSEFVILTESKDIKGNLSNLSINSTSSKDKINLDLDIKNVKILDFKAFEKLISSSDKKSKTNAVLNFLSEFIKEGALKSGKLKIDILKSDNVYKIEDISCDVYAENITFSYDKDLPPVTGINLKISNQDKKKVLFEVLTGNVNNTLIQNNSIVLLDTEKDLVVVNAYAIGSVTDLIGFIPQESVKKLQSMKMDLYSVNSIVNTKIDIDIPLEPHSPNIYKIKSKLKNFNFKPFDGKINLQSDSLNGIFTGDIVEISGHCKLNENKGYLKYTHNLNKKIQKADIFNIKLDLKQGTLFDAVSISGSNPEVFINYENERNADGILTIKSDLTKSLVEIKKLHVTKKQNAKSNFIAKSNIVDSDTLDFAINFNADDLDISGKLVHSNNKSYNANLNVTTKENKFNLNVKEDKNNMIVKIKSDFLDLSDVNFYKFFSPNKDVNNKGGNMDIQVNIAEVLMKNYITIDAVNLNALCDHKSCKSAHFNANIGSKTIDLILKDSKNKNTSFYLKTDNAGAFLSSIGVYDKMKSGVLTLTCDIYKTNTNDIEIKNGDFNIEKFVLTDNPFVLKLVSVASLHGLLNVITNNKNISFTKMKGDFDFKNDTIGLSRSIAEGHYFDFTMRGYIDMQQKIGKFKGGVTPSLYGVSSVAKKIPIINSFFSSKKNNGIVQAPYFFKFNF